MSYCVRQCITTVCFRSAGFLCSYISNKVILGAIPLAVNEVNGDPDLLPGDLTLDFLPADTGDVRKGQHKVRSTGIVEGEE